MIEYILLDIEGTTTSVSFVYDTLFPYFSKNAKAFVENNKGQGFINEVISSVQKTVLEEENREINESQAIEKLLEWTKNDRKHTALKTLQGYVWKEGYEKGEIKGHIYEDVLPNLQKWRSLGLKMGIYSSGSVKAQKLLFGQSVEGSLLEYFSHHFDTKIGHKRETNSYQNIQKEIDVNTEKILFLSDVEAELDAAKSAGFQTIQVVRVEDKTKPSEKHQKISNFEELNTVQG